MRASRDVQWCREPEQAVSIQYSTPIHHDVKYDSLMIELIVDKGVRYHKDFDLTTEYLLNKNNLQLTHNIGGAVEAVTECCFQKLHDEVHHVVRREGLGDAERARERREDAEGGAPAPTAGVTFS